MLNAHECFICPRPKEAAIVARWLDGHNPRGFVLRDGSLIVFNGYGNTHSSMAKYFNLGPRDIDFDFILQANGSVSVFNLVNRNAFSAEALAFLDAVARKRGAQQMRITFGE